MIELECPNCGGYGAIPKEKAHTRLVCKKCHCVFHIDGAGRARAGEPPADSGRRDDTRAVHAASHRVRLEDMPSLEIGSDTRSKILMGVLAVTLLGAGYYFFFTGAAESLGDVTTRVANAFAANDSATVTRLAAKGSEDDLAKACQEIHTDLEQLKKETTTQELLVMTLVIEENRRQRVGSSAAFFSPKSGPIRDETISKHAGAIPPKKRAVEINLPWSLDSSGRWKIDGHRLLQSVVTTQ